MSRAVLRRSAAVLAALAACALGAGILGGCRRSLENPADPGAPNFGGAILRADAGPEVRGSIGDTLLFRGAFAGDTTRVAQYSWDFDGDGARDAISTSGPEAGHAFPSAGAYAARFFVVGVGGDVDSATTSATVTDEAPVGTIGPDTVVAPGESLVTRPLVVDDGDVVRFEWDADGDGSYELSRATPEPVTSVFAADGESSVGLRVTDEDGRSASFARAVRVCPLPPAASPRYPADGTIFHPLRIVLRWSEEPGCAGPFQYDVLFGTTDPPRTLIRIASTVPEQDLGLLVHTQIYFWQVVTRDLGGRTVTSPVFSFRVRPVPRGMAYLPPGTAYIGSSSRANEMPAHDAYVDGFYLDSLEVSREQYAGFVAQSGYAPEGEPSQPGGGTENWPVAGVTWQDATAYAAWLGKALPTEAQWEAAARNYRSQRYPWGNPDPIRGSCHLANCYEFSGAPCNAEPIPVGSLPAGQTLAGVRDLAGNVAEWVADWYDAAYYAQSDAWVLPQGPPSGTEKVVKGGSWRSPLFEVRSSRRVPMPPETISDEIGFRCFVPIDSPPARFDTLGFGLLP